MTGMMRNIWRIGTVMGAMTLTLALRPPQQSAPSAAAIALGDSVFHGRVGGALCYVCHGPAGKGVAGLGPNLTDKEWLNSDGTLPSIEKIVQDGVPKPKKMPAPMPPKGGGQLGDAQIKAVAAYVWSLSNK